MKRLLLTAALIFCLRAQAEQSLSVAGIRHENGMTVTTLECLETEEGHYEAWMWVSFDCCKTWKGFLRFTMLAEGCFRVQVKDYFWSQPGPVFWKYELRKVYGPGPKR